MAQKDKLFTPFVLPISVGEDVSFPNHDSIKHHVYSFSSAKRFELKIYLDEKHPPITFDKPGVVEMGCNIHDWMLSYLVVVDTPYYSTSNINGTAELTLERGNHTLFVWHPRLNDKSEPISLEVDTDTQSSLTFQIEQTLLPEVVQSKPTTRQVHYDQY
ncbi:hypothetical protein [Vibrio profundi]|uniref:hypothetical protein n=1 Tax=Vibrio profundi TaxID=1774960 RepID=UPI003736E5FF